MQNRVQRAGIDAVTVTLQLLDQPKPEHRSGPRDEQQRLVVALR